MMIDDEFMVYGNDRSTPWLEKKGCPVHVSEMARNCDAVLTHDTWGSVLDEGVPVLLFPVVTDGWLVDIVAFEPSNPDKWYLREGKARILGAENLRYAKVYKTDLIVHNTPLDWMLSGMDGCVSLTCFSGEDFVGVKKIIGSKSTHEEICHAIRAAYPLPDFQMK